MKNFKKTILSMALAGGFILSAGAFSNANAQDWRQHRQRYNGYGQVDRNGNIDRNRNGIDDRYEVNGRVDRNQNGIPDQNERYWRYRNGGYYGNYGYYGYRNNGYNNPVRYTGWYDRFGRFHITGYYDAFGRFHRY
jgi:hypothetical protein